MLAGRDGAWHSSLDQHTTNSMAPYSVSRQRNRRWTPRPATVANFGNCAHVFRSKANGLSEAALARAGSFVARASARCGPVRMVSPNTVNLSARQRNPGTQEPTLVGPKSTACTPKLTVLWLAPRPATDFGDSVRRGRRYRVRSGSIRVCFRLPSQLVLSTCEAEVQPDATGMHTEGSRSRTAGV